MSEHEFYSDVGKTLRQIADSILLLASQLDVLIDRIADINQEALWRVEERARQRTDRLNEQVGDANLAMGALAEHEAQVAADLTKRIDTLEEQQG